MNTAGASIGEGSELIGIPDPIEVARVLIVAAKVSRQRRVLVLSGSADWARLTCMNVGEAFKVGTALWIGDRSPEGWQSCAPHGTRSLLGHELELVCIDAFAGFDPDDFGILSGALVAGGLLCLLCPSLDEWPHYRDPECARISVTGVDVSSGRFLSRFTGILEDAPGVHVIRQGQGARSIEPSEAPYQAPAILSEPRVGDDGCVNEEQRRAVKAVLRAATGHRWRPVVLTAHRGRGKSAALGLAAAELMAGAGAVIVVTGPSLASVESVFVHAMARYPGMQRQRTELIYGQSRLRFIAPDALAENPPTADLVIVDEAAALPQALLWHLLRGCPRLAMATTVHGYEGSGRAFELRFASRLDTERPGWRNIKLERPIRWSDGDPLEALSFRALLLDAGSTDPTVFRQASLANAQFERIDRDVLVADETLLEEVFGLLMLAHYRTRPLDLRQLLDGPTVSIWIARCAGCVAGVILLAEEGRLSPGLGKAVSDGRRRARGHLLPQVLAAHCGCPEILLLQGWRVLRLAVHPVAQRRGLGSALLGHVISVAARKKVDWVGASFGATRDLLAFWNQAGFFTLRIGATREAVSGAHAALVMKPLSGQGEAVYAALRQRFLDLIPHQLSDFLSGLEPGLVAQLLACEPGASCFASVPPGLLRDAQDFASGKRDYEDAVAAIWHLALHCFSVTGQLAPADSQWRVALSMKVLQKRSWMETASQLGLPGRKQVVGLLREAVNHCLE